ncbi:MAG: nuclear transport factor 2 family protein, partial [Pyrinomonadaceae bacterium]
MKKFTSILIAALAAISFAACGGTAENKPANANATNANTAKPVAVAPTKEALLDMEKKAGEAWTKGDTAYFESMLSDKFVSFNMGQRMDKAGELKMIGSVKCDVKSSSLDDAQMTKINDDAYALVYKSTFDGSCTFEGKTEKIPSPSRAASVWVRDGDKWKGAFHSETLILDPKSPPPPPAKTEAKKDEPKKDAETKKESPGNTDTLMKLHQAGWEAFKAKDAKYFGDNLASSFSFVDPAGNFVATKADAIKGWTETMKCEGITTVKVSDGIASAISPTLEVLTSKGTADGTCDGRKNGPLWQSAVYMKEGETWKLVFMFESPA